MGFRFGYIMKVVVKFWFFIGIALVILLAMLFPGLGGFVREYKILKVGIFLAFLVTGLTLQTKIIAQEVRNFKALIFSLISGFVIFPLIACPLAKLFWADNMDMIVGVTILAIAPVTVASGTVMSRIAGGNVSLSLFICVVSSFTAIFTIPLSLKLILGAENHVELPVMQMISNLSIVVLLPTVTGQLLRIKFVERIERCKKGFSIFSQIVILMIILNAVTNSIDKIQLMGFGVVFVFAFVIGLHAIILVMNFWLARIIGLSKECRATFTIHNSQKTLTVSFLVWSGYFAQYGMGLIPVVTYHLTQMVMDTIVAHRFKKFNS